MHQAECTCAACRRRAGVAFEVLEFGESRPGRQGAMVFSEAEELQLAMELLSVGSETELEQFLGNILKSAWKGLKKAGSAIGKVAAPLGAVLKTVARTALPFLGAALGSVIPIPGVGTALGTALGKAASSALEREFAEASPQREEAEELAMARRFVRIAGQAARLAADGDGSSRALDSAVTRALHRHLPYFRSGPPPMDEESGRWRRRGNRIVVMGDWT
ncbi:hypothetical protein ACL9RI_04955 [Janthinobacterium sp. Mn2066]|uniref:hypothetical protein n=1 Tax=Janthinobacterium sp. Mn2066 TaxID=3395264 RepID=UPI003BE50C3E